MKIAITAIGRLKSGPEYGLCLDYLSRSQKLGKMLGFNGLSLTEVEARVPQNADPKPYEAQKLLEPIDPSSHLIICDEHGLNLSSRAFSQSLAELRDGGVKKLDFVIGGADGLDQSVKIRAQSALAFGAQTWPHMLVRVMLLEQIYRAMTLMSGHPYHRD